MRVCLILMAAAMSLPLSGAGALELTLPGGATMTREVVRDPDSYLVPIAPFRADELPAREVEGRIRQQAWRLERTTLTTLQMLRPLREQLQNAGFDVILDCAGQECGGFDFRFSTRILPAPDMFVDLFDYRFLSAVRGGDADATGAEYVTAVVSRAGSTGYVQITQVASSGKDGLSVATGTAIAPGPDATGQLPANDPAGIVATLKASGFVILGDLDFGSGSSSLGDRSYASLAALAEFLNSDTTRRIALVGHTDTVGGLEPNIALSRRRAESVLERLATVHGVARDQLETGGVAYLSPIASNLTAGGREANRRVEAVLLNTE